MSVQNSINNVTYQDLPRGGEGRVLIRSNARGAREIINMRLPEYRAGGRGNMKKELLS